ADRSTTGPARIPSRGARRALRPSPDTGGFPWSPELNGDPRSRASVLAAALVVYGGEKELEGADLGGLDEVVVEAGFAGAAAVGVLAPAGEGDEGGAALGEAAADAARDFVAVHARHADVEEDH